MKQNLAKMSSHWYTLRLKISVYWNFHSVEYWYTSTHGKNPETCGKRLLTADAVSALLVICPFLNSQQQTQRSKTTDLNHDK